jgi:hypothetical protein
MAYGYRYQLPEGLDNDQNRQLINLAITTARNASAVNTGDFRKGWTAGISNDILTVKNNVRYAIYLEMGTVLSRRHRYKVRDALNRIGFDTGTPVVTDPDTAAEIDRADRNQNPQGDNVAIETGAPSGAGQPASNIEGANPLGMDDILLPSEDPVDILITSIPLLNDKIRPDITYAINTQQEAIEAYKKLVQGFDIPTIESAIEMRRKLIGQKVPVIDLFNKAAMIALLATMAADSQEEETNERNTNI